MTTATENMEGVTIKKVDHYCPEHKAYDVHKNGQKIGRVHSYTGHNDKNDKNRRIVIRRTKVKRWMAKAEGETRTSMYHHTRSSAIEHVANFVSN